MRRSKPCFCLQEHHIGHDTGAGNVQDTIRRLISVSGAGGAAGIHDIDAVFIGALGYVGVSVKCNVTALFQGSLFQVVQCGVDPIAVTMGGKDTMSRHQINGLCQRCFTAVVAVALDIAELVSDLRHIPAEQLIFAFAVSQVDEHIRIRVAQDDGFKITVLID